MSPDSLPPEGSRLRALGVSHEAETAYGELLDQGVQPSGAAAQELLATGLTHDLDGQHVPVSIQAVLGAWESARAAEAATTRAASLDFVARYESFMARSGSTGFIEVLRGRAATLDAAHRLMLEAQESIDELIRGPFVQGADQEMPDEQPAASERGVKYRVLYASALVAHPSSAEAIFESIRLGEEARVSFDVPLRLMIIDNSRALVVLPNPATPGDNLRASDADALLVHPSPMLDALIRLFEQFWAGGEPLNADANDGDDTQQMLSLLALGMTDAAIARSLGISERTVHRRISGLATELGVVSRFQLGAEAQRRGLL